MYLRFQKKLDTLVVDLVGELDHHYADLVRTKIDDRIDRDNIKNVILNFGEVTFMDSSGIGAIVGRYKKIKKKQGSFCITDARNNVSKVLELSGLLKVIDYYDNVDEALEVLKMEGNYRNA
ncbi:anti-sigma F factor antagonist [Clostridium sp. MSJ-8]|uniref:anti-sigma F factor antagonist n=1 Tax=Clostridium sp. MSJ-8 TaxID=2841510 RepID=UPI001C0E986B|nr:anti-sigma F factor antagonist [Clostridium sp. MSJ-8]MBU5486584.1 anti-sigma F factor antagonist [Clostridium sp. MSJ-8]